MCDQSTACNPHTYGTGIEHHKEGGSDYTWPHTAFTVLPHDDDEQCHTQTHPQLESGHHWLHGPGVYGVYRQPRAADCRTVLQNWQDKTPKASHKKRSIVEYSPGLPQDTKSSGDCSGNRAKMLMLSWNIIIWVTILCYLGIKCHSQYNKVIRLHRHSSANR